MKLLFKRLLSYFPTALPVGMAEFEAWSLSIREICGSGLEQVPQYQFNWVLASAVQHLSNTKSSVPKRYFVNVLRKGAATQIAAQVFLDSKTKQTEEQAKLAEATAKQEAAANVAPDAQIQNT